LYTRIAKHIIGPIGTKKVSKDEPKDSINQTIGLLFKVLEYKQTTAEINIDAIKSPKISGSMIGSFAISLMIG
jgi:hypothetical protein